MLLRGAAAFLLLVAFALAARAGARTPPENPHGKFHEPCGQCHGADAWRPARVGPGFDHARFGFPLEGAHASASCAACHGSLDFTRTERQCASCHEDPHRGEMGSDCSRCHGARSFIDPAALMRAHQLTHFPLVGAHAGLACETCHRPAAQGQLRFVGTASACRDCHMDDYRAAKEPDHVASGFPTNCMECHSALTWQGARFNHDRSRFPLTGAHRAVACASCHGDGVYAGKSTACASCHQSAYDAATDPSHAAAGFPLTCQSCHTTTTWVGATFNHDGSFFPIYSGTHSGRWSACSTCHTNSSNYAVFTCFSCHPHDDRAGTDSHHTQVQNYQYDSQACYSCHPRGTH
jgi:hypothetical protein